MKRYALLLSLALIAQVAYAEGTVTQIAGLLTAQKSDGTIKVLGPRSTVEGGDLLRSEKDTYALVKFTDGGLLTIKPNTQLKIEAYTFDQAQPEKDNVAFSLLKGGLRKITGLIGKRGNQDAWRLTTPTATIGIRGTTIDVHYVPLGEAMMSGTFLSVSAGVAFMQTGAGIQTFVAGQSGHAPTVDQLPITLPSPPPQTQYVPPPSFNTNQPPACAVY